MDRNRSVYRLHEGEKILTTRGFIFTTSIEDHNEDDEHSQFDKLYEYLRQFLPALRYVSKSPNIPQIENFQTSRTIYLVKLPEHTGIIHMNIGSGIINGLLVDMAIRWDHIASVDESIKKGSPPVSASLLLDSISALLAHDFRRAIIYSGMAMEVAAATTLDEVQGAIIDPVYKFLRKQARMSQMLHEVPLYVLKRSLLSEEKEVFHEALRTYKLRNMIAHGGEVKRLVMNSNEEFEREEARAAVLSAIAVFRWFCLDHAYVVPKGFAYFYRQDGRLIELP
jgi:hypothetical protein